MKNIFASGCFSENELHGKFKCMLFRSHNWVGSKISSMEAEHFPDELFYNVFNWNLFLLLQIRLTLSYNNTRVFISHTSFLNNILIYLAFIPVDALLHNYDLGSAITKLQSVNQSINLYQSIIKSISQCLADLHSASATSAACSLKSCLSQHPCFLSSLLGGYLVDDIRSGSFPRYAELISQLQLLISRQRITADTRVENRARATSWWGEKVWIMTGQGGKHRRDNGTTGG